MHVYVRACMFMRVPGRRKEGCVCVRAWQRGGGGPAVGIRGACEVEGVGP